VSAAILVFHSDFRTSRVNRAWADADRQAGYTVRDLYAMYPSGQIDVQVEQAVCESVQTLVFQHPINWYGPPWLMKRWIDEVLQFDWAYGSQFALNGKLWAQAMSVGAGEAEYRPEGSRRYPAEEFLKPFERTAAFCQMRFTSFIRYGAGYESSEGVAQWTEAYVAWLNALTASPEPHESCGQ
jgi:putative NADPH-quinone reductase